jgi:hypothetical protein
MSKSGIISSFLFLVLVRYNGKEKEGLVRTLLTQDLIKSKFVELLVTV